MTFARKRGSPCLYCLGGTLNILAVSGSGENDVNGELKSLSSSTLSR